MCKGIGISLSMYLPACGCLLRVVSLPQRRESGSRLTSVVSTLSYVYGLEPAGLMKSSILSSSFSCQVEKTGGGGDPKNSQGGGSQDGGGGGRYNRRGGGGKKKKKEERERRGA